MWFTYDNNYVHFEVTVECCGHLKNVMNKFISCTQEEQSAAHVITRDHSAFFFCTKGLAHEICLL